MVKNPPPSAGDAGSILGWGRSPGEGNGNLLQYSCLENPMDRGAWRAIVHGVAKSRTRLSDFTQTVALKRDPYSRKHRPPPKRPAPHIDVRVEP